jgi:hypothetical protein
MVGENNIEVVTVYPLMMIPIKAAREETVCSTCGNSVDSHYSIRLFGVGG